MTGEVTIFNKNNSSIAQTLYLFNKLEYDSILNIDTISAMKTDQKQDQSIGSRIRAIRITTELNQGEFASTFGFSASYQSEIETGKVTPSFEYINKLIELYPVDLNYLWFGKEWTHPKKDAPTKEINIDTLELIETEDEFQYVFDNAPIFRNLVLAETYNIYSSNREVIKKSLKKSKSRKNKKNGD
jgi:transcriptional regulator with XRE-family HTH domain